MRGKLFVRIVLFSFLAVSHIVFVQELPIVAIVPSYNNAKWCLKTLDSIFSQKYHNYRVVYIDDASTDGTAEIVENYINKRDLHDRCILIKNKKRCRKTKNIYNAIHDCDDREIVVQIDGDDWLGNPNVFSTLNKEYTENDIWLTYGQFRNMTLENGKWVPKKIGYSKATLGRIIDKRLFRKGGWHYMQQRTFYAWLFKLIKLEDFIGYNVPGYKGDFYPESSDLAMMYPMLEMAYRRFKFIPSVDYMRNVATPLNAFKVDVKIQASSGHEIHQRPAPYYPAVKEPVIDRLEGLDNAKIDLVILSLRDTSDLRNFLKSVHDYVVGVSNIYVFYCSSDNVKDVEYQNIASQYSCSLINVDGLSSDSKGIARHINSLNDYVIFSNDSCTVVDTVDLSSCVTMLERTLAHAFYLGFGADQPPFRKEQREGAIACQHIDGPVYAWKFRCAEEKWKVANAATPTIYRKNDFIEKIKSVKTVNIEQFYTEWDKLTVRLDSMGLFLEQCKIKSIF